MKFYILFVLSILLGACANSKTEAEYKEAGYCFREFNWYPTGTVIDLKAGKKISCEGGYWEPLDF